MKNILSEANIFLFLHGGSTHRVIFDVCFLLKRLFGLKPDPELYGLRLEIEF